MAEKIVSTTTDIKSRLDFGDLDALNVDPDRLDLGTRQQDCVLIAQTFERGAHATPTEAAIFATITRTLQNNKQFTGIASKNLSSYLQVPQDSASKALAQAEQFAGGAGEVQTGGASAATDHIMQSLNVGDQKQATHGSSFGEKLLETARDCIPCDLRLSAFLELHPNIDLLGVLEDYAKNALSMLSDITNMLKNFDIYGDFCELLNLLSFMCIPDLQRIIALLMAMFMLDVPKLDGLIGMLQAIIMPLFAPILMGITALLDQFSALVTSPLQCVVDAINSQLTKLNAAKQIPRVSEVTQYKHSAREDYARKVELPIGELTTGIEQLGKELQDGIKEIQNKMNFYISQVKAMLSEIGGGDAAYLKVKMQMLQRIRLISFIIAIIMALAKGHAACSSTGKPPEASEIDNFFNNFLNPNSPFNIWIDDDGQMHIDEKVPDFDTTVKPPHTGVPLPQFGNVLQFEGEDLLDLSAVATQISAELAEPVRVMVPCKLETSVEDAERVQQWISQLNRV